MSQADAALIESFYAAFQRGDWAAMAACYHADAQFSDPVFTDLRGRQPAAMWRMLIEGAGALTIRYRDIQAHSGRASAHWEADYPFSQTGRTVRNRIVAEFDLRDGLILRHHDTFNFWAWSRMALGVPGLLLGWSPLLRNKVRRMAAQRLARFLDKHPEYR